jgi:hypothetical protein
MRRNTRGSKWVSADKEHRTIPRSSPGKTVTFEKQQSWYPHDAAPAYEHHTESGMPHRLSPPPILRAAIYDPADLRDLLDTHANLPSVRSWSSLRSNAHDDDGDVSPRTAKPSNRPHIESPISPLQGDPMAWRDSAISGVDVKDFASDRKGRQDSNATVFPSFPHSIKKSEPKSKDPEVEQTPHNLTDFYHTAKAIYAVGPKGEGQKLWASYKQSLQAKQDQTKIKREPMKAAPTTRRPSDAPGLSAHPPTRPPSSQDRIEPRKPVPLLESLYPRKESSLSNTSWEVPIRIGPDVGQRIDRSKPLPSVPWLQAAPNSRQQEYINLVSKPLPSVPRSQTLPREHAGPSKPLPPLPKLQSAPKGRKGQPAKPTVPPAQTGLPSSAPSRTQSPTHHLATKPTNWWKSLAEKTSENYIPTSLHFKPAISRPRPITAFQNGLTATLASERGGVGGPGAAFPRPLSDKAKGKQKATRVASSPLGAHFPKGWSEKLGSPEKQMMGKRDRDSDVSFACVGMGDGYGARGYGESPVLGSEMGGSSVRSSEGSSRAGMRPEPLFSGMRGGASERDTKFYGPVHEVLDEYGR